MNKNEELISVIIPVYNVENYLEKCLDTVINQTYSNLEIVIIDDGSTDRSGEISENYIQKDTRIKVIHQDNKGLACVRNRGLQEATGKYVFWVDSDDYISHDIIEHLYKNIKENNAQISICNYVQGPCRDYEFLEEVNDTIVVDWKKALELIYKNQEYAFRMVAVWAKLIERTLYEDIYFPEKKLFEDIYTSHKVISRARKIVISEKKLYYYYQNENSILGKKLTVNKLDYLEAFEERIAFFENCGLEELSKTARIQYLHALIWEYSRAKDILHDREMVTDIKRQYRKYYKLGTANKNVKHETKGYMFAFYLWPWGQDFMNKVKAKIRRN